MAEMTADPSAEQMLDHFRSLVDELAEVLDARRALDCPIDVVPVALTHILASYMESLDTHDERLVLISRVTKLLLSRATKCNTPVVQS